jgi:low temperature requirement protein LtrA
VSDAEHEIEDDDEHQVTPLELFFDLTFVFAITQVTILLADDPTWGGSFAGCSSSRRSGGRGPSTRG